MRRSPRQHARAMRVGTVAWLALGMLTACPDVRSGGPEARCVKAYAQCKLPTGALGVCDAVECAAGEPAPCLVCRSQH